MGRTELYDKLIDLGIAVLALRVVFDIIGYDMGVGLQSVLAGSGIGALVFSLASKDVRPSLVGSLYKLGMRLKKGIQSNLTMELKVKY